MLGTMRKELHAEIEKYKHCLQELPLSSALAIPVHFALGRLHQRTGDTAAAIQEFALVALAYADQGNILKAMVAAQMIKKLDPQNTELFARLEELYGLQRTVPDSQMQAYQESLQHLDALQSIPQESVAPEKETQQEAPISVPTPETTLDVVSVLQQIPVFGRLSVSELRGIYTHSVLRRFASQESIISSGDFRQALFAIVQGSVNVIGRDNDQRETIMATLPAGNSFGEIALFGEIDPTLSVAAAEPCTILEISRDLILKLAKTRPEMLDHLKDLYRRRILNLALARVSLLHQLTPQARQQLTTYFKPVKAEKGTTLVREAESNDSLYFVATGELGVYTAFVFGEEESDATPSAEDLVLLTTLKSGDFFGEQSLVSDEPNAATVTALTDVVLFQFSKHDLSAVIQAYPGIQAVLNIEAFKQERLKKLAKVKQLMEPVKA
jgi:CRP-like cAMP-binding protein